MVFDDEFSTVIFIREGTIPPNWTYLVQRISQSGAPEYIDIKDTWLTLDIEKYTIGTLTYILRVSPENQINMMTSSHNLQQVDKIMVRKGASVYGVIECTVSKGVRNISNLKKVYLAQQSPDMPSGVPSREG